MIQILSYNVSIFHLFANGYLRISYTLLISLVAFILILGAILLFKQKEVSAIQGTLVLEQKKGTSIRKKLERQIRTTIAQKESLITDISDLKKQLNNHAEKLKERDDRIRVLNQNLSQRIDENKKLLNEKSSLELSLKEMETSLERKKMELLTLHDDILEKDKKIKLINDVVSKLQKEKINLNKTVEAKDQEYEQLQQQLTIIENRIKDMEKNNSLNPFERLANW